MQLQFTVLRRFLPRHLFISVPTLDDLKGLPPWKVPEHIVLLPATIFTVFWHNSPLPGSSWQTFLCPQTTHILWNMLTPVFSIFKLSFLTSLIGTVESAGRGGVTWKLCVLDSQMKTSRHFFYGGGGILMSDLAPRSWSSCFVFFMGCDPVLDYSKDSKAEH